MTTIPFYSTNKRLNCEDFMQSVKGVQNISKDGEKKIRKAFKYAEEVHRGQKRFSGDLYLSHAVIVALNIASLRLGTETIEAALLHDTIEDSGKTIKEIKKTFGDEVAFLVSGVTKVNRIKYRGAQRAAESIRKMFLAVAQDIRIVILKLVDRLHNMQTLDFLPHEEKRQRIAAETLDIYAPLADRLGMWELKASLEDLAFKYVYPKEHKMVATELKKRLPERQEYLERVIPIIKRELIKENIKPIEISRRVKHNYSIFHKLQRRDMDWSRILDLLALRIIVENVEQCYTVLGVVHKLWRPLPKRIKDYIALPKPNGYKSLHTTVFCLDSKVTEFQIRTVDMHRESEFGIAAHWAWDEAGKPKNGAGLGSKSNWVSQLQNWQKEFKKNKQSSEEFVESLKIDFFNDRIFVLTPKGDVLDLPEGATPIDFAYNIHTEIGDRATGAKVNSKMVALKTSLKSGDVVEIIIQKNKKLSAEWINFAKTSLAKNRIKRRLNIGRPPKNFDETKVELIIEAQDRVGLIKDITEILQTFRVNIESISSNVKEDLRPVTYIHFHKKNNGQLERIKTRLKKIPGVETVGEKNKR